MIVKGGMPSDQPKVCRRCGSVSAGPYIWEGNCSAARPCVQTDLPMPERQRPAQAGGNNTEPPEGGLKKKKKKELQNL